VSDLKRKWPRLPDYQNGYYAQDADFTTAVEMKFLKAKWDDWFQGYLEANIPEPLLSQLAPREPMRIESRHVVNRGVSGLGWIEAIMLDSEWACRRVKVTIEEIL
jgi:hypothetical protein